MKKLACFCAFFAVVMTVGCSKNTGPVSGGGDVVATVNGAQITASELDTEVKGQLQRVESQIFQIKKQGLDGMIEKKLVENAAKKKGQSAEDYIKEEVDSKVTEPTEEELRALYDTRKGKDTLPFEKVKDQIISYLKVSKKDKLEQDLIAKLKSESDVKVLMEPPRIEIDTGDAPAVGPKNAKVTLVEFSDYQCPYCKRIRPTIWKLVEDYKDKLRYVFMDFPLSFHQFSRKAHEAAHCAGDQGKYFDYNKKIFDNQNNISVADLKKYAKELNLNTSKFDKCLDSGAHAKHVEELLQKGIKVGVSGTPAYYINGVQLAGAQGPQAFKEIIEEELKK